MTTFTDEVREAYGTGHKFDSRRAAAAWLVTLDGCHDEETGDANEWEVWMARLGRTIVETDSQGFVYASSFAKESDAIAVFSSTDNAYAEYLEEQEAEATAYAEGFRDVDPASVSEFEPGSAVRVLGMEGIAYRVIGLPERRLPSSEWSGITLYHPHRRLVHMVGDDCTYDVHTDELEPLDEEEFCGSCGQIGCPWH